MLNENEIIKLKELIYKTCINQLFELRDYVVVKIQKDGRSRNYKDHQIIN